LTSAGGSRYKGTELAREDGVCRQDGCRSEWASWEEGGSSRKVAGGTGRRPGVGRRRLRVGCGGGFVTAANDPGRFVHLDVSGKDTPPLLAGRRSAARVGDQEPSRVGRCGMAFQAMDHGQDARATRKNARRGGDLPKKKALHCSFIDQAWLAWRAVSPVADNSGVARRRGESARLRGGSENSDCQSQEGWR